MIEFDANCHTNNVTVSITRAGVDFTAIIGGDSFEGALDGLLDGYFLDDWLKETMKGKAEHCCDRGVISDEQLENFLTVLEEII